MRELENIAQNPAASIEDFDRRSAALRSELKELHENAAESVRILNEALNKNPSNAHILMEIKRATEYLESVSTLQGNLERQIPKLRRDFIPAPAQPGGSAKKPLIDRAQDACYQLSLHSRTMKDLGTTACQNQYDDDIGELSQVKEEVQKKIDSLTTRNDQAALKEKDHWLSVKAMIEGTAYAATQSVQEFSSLRGITKWSLSEAREEMGAYKAAQGQITGRLQALAGDCTQPVTRYGIFGRITRKQQTRSLEEDLKDLERQTMELMGKSVQGKVSPSDLKLLRDINQKIEQAKARLESIRPAVGKAASSEQFLQLALFRSHIEALTQRVDHLQKLSPPKQLTVDPGSIWSRSATLSRDIEQTLKSSGVKQARSFHKNCKDAMELCKDIDQQFLQEKNLEIKKMLLDKKRMVLTILARAHSEIFSPKSKTRKEESLAADRLIAGVALVEEGPKAVTYVINAMTTAVYFESDKSQSADLRLSVKTCIFLMNEEDKAQIPKELQDAYDKMALVQEETPGTKKTAQEKAAILVSKFEKTLIEAKKPPKSDDDKASVLRANRQLTDIAFDHVSTIGDHREPIQDCLKKNELKLTEEEEKFLERSSRPHDLSPKEQLTFKILLSKLTLLAIYHPNGQERNKNLERVKTMEAMASSGKNAIFLRNFLKEPASAGLFELLGLCRALSEAPPVPPRKEGRKPVAVALAEQVLRMHRLTTTQDDIRKNINQIISLVPEFCENVVKRFETDKTSTEYYRKMLLDLSTTLRQIDNAKFAGAILSLQETVDQFPPPEPLAGRAAQAGPPPVPATPAPALPVAGRVQPPPGPAPARPPVAGLTQPPPLVPPPPHATAPEGQAPQAAAPAAPPAAPQIPIDRTPPPSRALTPEETAKLTGVVRDIEACKDLSDLEKLQKRLTRERFSAPLLGAIKKKIEEEQVESGKALEVFYELEKAFLMLESALKTKAPGKVPQENLDALRELVSSNSLRFAPLRYGEGLRQLEISPQEAARTLLERIEKKLEERTLQIAGPSPRRPFEQQPPAALTPPPPLVPPPGRRETRPDIRAPSPRPGGEPEPTVAPGAPQPPHEEVLAMTPPPPGVSPLLKGPWGDASFKDQYDATRFAQDKSGDETYDVACAFADAMYRKGGLIEESALAKRAKEFGEAFVNPESTDGDKTALVLKLQREALHM